MKTNDMKKMWVKSMVFFVLMGCMAFFMGCNEESNIPVPAQEFIKEYFPKYQGVFPEIDGGAGGNGCG